MLMAIIKENYCCQRSFLETLMGRGGVGAQCSPLTYCGCHVYVILVIAQEWLRSHGSIAV